MSEAVIADIEDLKRTVGEHIRFAREGHQMSQIDLARRVGAYDYRVIGDYEKGRVLPTEKRLIKIAIVLERDYAWFFVPHEFEKSGRAA